METLTEVPTRTVHTYETDDETVLEVQLSEQPVLTLSLEDQTLTLRIPRGEPGPELAISPAVVHPMSGTSPARSRMSVRSNGRSCDGEQNTTSSFAS